MGIIIDNHICDRHSIPSISNVHSMRVCQSEFVNCSADWRIVCTFETYISKALSSCSIVMIHKFILPQFGLWIQNI